MKSNIAIVGGGRFCKIFLKFISDKDFACQRPKVLGVADKNENAPGLRLAKQMGIFTTKYYTDLYHLKNLKIILELTNDRTLADEIKKAKPRRIKVIDHFETRAMWDFIQVEDAKLKCFKKLKQVKYDPDSVDELLKNLTEKYNTVLRQRNKRSHEIEMELVDQERAQSQIIQGSTIPTFVINKEHEVTHWNKAMEKLTGIVCYDIVGTDKQWIPFYEKKRPTMADVILDQCDENEIRKLYGKDWRKSALIENAYEAEGFFPNLGEEGKWCWFTAAPIKAPDGTIVGAIETLWDKTEDKKAEEEKKRHTRELTALCSIYAALSAPADLNKRINNAVIEMSQFLMADSICVFTRRDDDTFNIKYMYGISEIECHENILANKNCIIHKVLKTNEIAIFENLPCGTDLSIGVLKSERLKSLAYIPISAKKKRALGIIRIGSKTSRNFSPGDRNVLELIGNRIGVAIENAMLQEQYIKSEKKYRSLFNNDPNPIFILDSKTFEILDTNQRALDCYGYTRNEFFGFPFLNLGDKNDEEVETGLKKMSYGQSVLFSKKKHYKKDGHPFYVNINVSLAKYGEEDVLIATTTDITETVEKETQLIQAGKMATLGLMAAGMAHEINQPLNVIQICADFFLKTLKKGIDINREDFISMAQDIVDNVNRATGVIKHVRAFARQSEIVRNRVNINDPIKDVFKVLGHQIKVHQIELDLNLDPDLPYILAEHNRLEQVFINLVTNAIDAMDEKCSKPGCKRCEKKLKIETFAKWGYVTVKVTDTGIGMSEEVKNKIFEPFFTTKEVGKGTGLGISISYGIVKDYNGSIELESKEGEGTTFILRFPALTED